MRPLLLTFFIITTTFMLLVGDGKSGLVELVVVGGVLGLSVVVRARAPIRVPGGFVLIWWAMVLLYFYIRLPFSDSVAYSIYATARYVIAFVVFVLFANNIVSVRDFLSCVIGAALMAMLLSFILLVASPPRQWLPEMSLLLNDYGHHNISYLLVFVLPITIHELKRKTTYTRAALIAIILTALIFTRARQAWIITAAYMLFATFQVTSLEMRRAFTITTLVFLLGFIMTLAPSKASPVYWFGLAQKEKTGLLLARVRYWQQAEKSIKERPWFGGGLGTFYLSSLRHQSSPQSYSWFTHSYPLQLFSEVGAIGVLAMIGVAWVIGRATLRVYTDERQAAVEAIILTGIYSTSDMALDYLVMWVLVWATLGLLYGLSEKAKKTHPDGSVTFYCAIGSLVFFYFVSTGLEIGQAMTKGTIFTQPYNTARTIAFLNNCSLSTKQIDIILWFHKLNPDVHSATANCAEKIGQLIEAQKHYRIAIYLDSKNLLLQRRFVNFLLNTNQYKKAYIFFLDSMPLSVNIEVKKHRINYESGIISEENKQHIINIIKSSWDELMYAKLFYLYGFSTMRSQPGATNTYWKLSQALALGWNNYYIERAALYYHIFRDKEEASKILTQCLYVIKNDEYCRELLIHPSHIPEPGHLKERVDEF